MSEATCVFCDLIESGDATWVARYPEAVAFRPLPESELAPGHTLVVPRAHVDGFLAATPAQLEATMTAVQQVAEAMRTTLGATGTCILQASGPDSGGSVPHLHFHVVPCWNDDDVTFWPEAKSAHRVDGQPHALLSEALSGHPL